MCSTRHMVKGRRYGPQEGRESAAGLLVSLVWPEPSAFITYISVLPSRKEWKAMLAPSGDQEGTRS